MPHTLNKNRECFTDKLYKSMLERGVEDLDWLLSIGVNMHCKIAMQGLDEFNDEIDTAASPHSSLDTAVKATLCAITYFKAIKPDDPRIPAFCAQLNAISIKASELAYQLLSQFRPVERPRTVTEVSYCKPLSQIVIAIVKTTLRLSKDVGELIDGLATFAWCTFSVTEDAFDLAEETDNPREARIEALAVSEMAQPIHFELSEFIRQLVIEDELDLLNMRCGTTTVSAE